MPDYFETLRAFDKRLSVLVVANYALTFPVFTTNTYLLRGSNGVVFVDKASVAPRILLLVLDLLLLLRFLSNGKLERPTDWPLFIRFLHLRWIFHE